MHRLVLGVTDRSLMVDHKNRIKTDNRKNNLRICTSSENNKNVAPYGKSKYLGVCVINQKRGIRYVAKIRISGERKHIGIFETEVQAAKAYDSLAAAHHKQFANLNFPS